MQQNKLNQGLKSFIKSSPTPFHAATNIAARLQGQGFQQLYESQNWDLQAGGKYYVLRNDSVVVAFVLGDKSLEDSGFRMVGAHTDSPCLKVKPQPILQEKGYLQLGVEVYGGALLNPWFDRDLSLAGRVTCQQGDTVRSALINFKRAIAVIPSLAIHLDKEANKNRTVNPQQHLPPILAILGEESPDWQQLLLDQLLIEYPDCAADSILGYELSFYDTQPPALVGLNAEFIAAARLDNLLSCYIGLESLLAADVGQNRLLICNDHEEVGSSSTAGASGPLLKSVFERIAPDPQQRARMIDRSLLISADNAHGIHPNYTDRHDQNHGPLLNQGPVIKINANQRYASNSETAAVFRHLCEQESVSVQSFVVRTDMGCGSTIGPITAAELGVNTVDVGVPTFGMHSIRELAGSQDAHDLYKVFKRFYTSDPLLS